METRPPDYRDDVRLETRPWRRRFFGAMGTVCLILGLVGIFLPVLPTAPFLLLASICYARSSERLYLWLMNHRWFGPPLRDWKATKALPLQVKTLAITMIVMSAGVSVLFIIPRLPVQIGVAVCCAAVCLYLAFGIPTRR